MGHNRFRVVQAVVAGAVALVLGLAGQAPAAIIFSESFEDPDVLNDTAATDPTGWSTTGHPSYLRLVDENDTPSLFTTPDGSQGLSCYNGNKTSFATTTSSILSDTVSLGTTYTLSFNVSKTGGSVGEYYAAILAVDGGGTETVLGYTSGDNDGSNDMSFSDSVVVTAASNDGQRLAIRLGMDPDWTDWHNSSIIDNVQLDAVAAADVPEPGALVLIASGLVALAYFGRRRRRQP